MGVRLTVPVCQRAGEVGLIGYSETLFSVRAAFVAGDTVVSSKDDSVASVAPAVRLSACHSSSTSYS